jgi:predicted transcriptional regulator
MVTKPTGIIYFSWTFIKVGVAVQKRKLVVHASKTRKSKVSFLGERVKNDVSNVLQRVTMLLRIGFYFRKEPNNGIV